MWTHRHLPSWDSLFVNKARNSDDTNLIWIQTPIFIPETHKLFESSKPGDNWGTVRFKIQYFAVFIIKNSYKDMSFTLMLLIYHHLNQMHFTFPNKTYAYSFSKIIDLTPGSSLSF